MTLLKIHLILTTKTHIKNTEGMSVNNSIMHLKALGKPEQKTPKAIVQKRSPKSGLLLKQKQKTTQRINETESFL